MLLILLLSPPSMPGQPAVHVVWNDPYALYPTAGCDSMTYELESLFEHNGLDVRMHVARKGEPAATTHGPRVNVIVSAGNARGYGLREDTMAVAVGERSTGFTIFIFISEVRATLGHSPASHPAAPRELAELSRALSRVVAHELVHVLAPERGHARSGLMTPKLTRRLLLDRTIELDAASRRMARDRLEHLAS